jgi:hypothetical protein
VTPRARAGARMGGRMVEELERSRAKSAQRYHEEHDDA